MIRIECNWLPSIEYLIMYISNNSASKMHSSLLLYRLMLMLVLCLWDVDKVSLLYTTAHKPTHNLGFPFHFYYKNVEEWNKLIVYFNPHWKFPTSSFRTQHQSIYYICTHTSYTIKALYVNGIIMLLCKYSRTCIIEFRLKYVEAYSIGLKSQW